MNQKKNGFTLIELLAVIVILAIIALIAVPVIMNIIDKANESTFKDSAYGVINAGELYFAERQLEPNGMLEDVTFNLPDTTKTLQLKGEVPEGTITITKEGKISIAVYNNRYCVTKGIEDKDVTVTENLENCTLPLPGKKISELATVSTEVTSVPSCLNDGTECTPGTPVAIKVNESEVYNFYVISEKNNEVMLIMDRNLYSEMDPNYGNVAWINASDYAEANTDGTHCILESCNDEGPITAVQTLKERTSSWTNIPERTYTYSDDGGYREYVNYPEYNFVMYETFSETMRARMLTYTEANSIKTANNNELPEWLYINLNATSDNNTTGYWLTSSTTAPAYANSISWDGFYYTIYFPNVYSTTHGVRPVITLSK